MKDFWVEKNCYKNTLIAINTLTPVKAKQIMISKIFKRKHELVCFLLCCYEWHPSLTFVHCLLRIFVSNYLFFNSRHETLMKIISPNGFAMFVDAVSWVF